MTEKEVLSFLRESIKTQLSPWRYAHTLAVEEEAYALAKIFLPQKTYPVRVAALLHDITKDFNKEKQLNLCREFDIITKDSALYPKIMHSFTGAEWIAREYSDIVNDEIVSAVRYHTTGRASMTIFECLLYLADYIEPTRAFEDCRALRSYFYSELSKNPANPIEVLRKTMILSFDLSITNLIREGESVFPDTIFARNYFINEKDAFIAFHKGISE